MSTTFAFPEKMTDLPVFDIDAHWTEPADLWTSRAPRKYKERVMHVKTHDDGSQAWYVGDAMVAPVGIAVISHDLSKELWKFTHTNYDQMSTSMTRAQERVHVLDKLGIGSQILYPNAIGFGAATLQSVDSDDELRLFHVQAYNDALAEEQRASGGRVLGQAVLPFWDIDAATAELTRAREELGLVGISMTDQPDEWQQPSLVDPKWDSFWAACQDLEVPVNFHIGSGNFEAASTAGRAKYWGDQVFLRPDGSMNGNLAMFSSVAMFMGNVYDVLNLLTTDLLERFPRLKFVSVESGISWVPYIIQSLEVNFRELMSPSQRARYKRSPRERFMDQINVSYWFEDANSVDFYVKEMGADNVMFQTDMPHPNCLYPGVQTKVRETISGLDDETQRKILYENAEKLYGVSVGAVGGS
ncbi:MAG TPA: amidohydrolase [Deltaproteobacteria bacterium]|nr:amidohydrolase [Deltaproteobacteria bacterium]